MSVRAWAVAVLSAHKTRGVPWWEGGVPASFIPGFGAPGFGPASSPSA